MKNFNKIPTTNPEIVPAFTPISEIQDAIDAGVITPLIVSHPETGEQITHLSISEREALENFRKEDE
jgi:hypothetical protein